MNIMQVAPTVADPAYLETADETKKNFVPRNEPPRRRRRHLDRHCCEFNEKPVRGKNHRRNSRRQGVKRQQQKRTAAANSTAAPSLPDESLFAALDCEMVGVGPDGHSSSVARVTLIDWDGQTLFDEYIQQTEPVTDYRTFVSGITEEHLAGATLSPEDCRVRVLRLLENRILVGHALKNDLRALDISHSWWLIRDTAKYEPFMQVRFDDGIHWPRKLKDLANEKLHQEIQVEGRPHSPYEDALAALDLYRSVRPKWEKVIQYKVEKTNQIQQQQHQDTPAPAAQ
jgi:RNA exonuclease 4